MVLERGRGGVYQVLGVCFGLYSSKKYFPGCLLAKEISW